MCSTTRRTAARCRTCCPACARRRRSRRPASSSKPTPSGISSGRRRWRACSAATRKHSRARWRSPKPARFSLDELVYEYPDEPTPPGKTPQAHLEELAWEGAHWRFPDGIPEKVHALITRELQLIAELKYAQYFLTVHDIVHFARSKDILCQGRGSAANSVVCYCLAITSVDPTEIDVLFERFVSPERKRAARHRRRLRARAARGGDPVHLRPLRPRPRRARRHRHLLSRALGGPRRRQGHGAFRGHGRRRSPAWCGER